MGDATHSVEREDWYQRLISPIREALYANDQPRAAAALKEAWEELVALGLAADQHELMGYVLSWYEFVKTVQDQPIGLAAAQYRRMLERFSVPARTPAGEAQRRRMLAILRCTGHLYDCADLTRAELDQLLDGLPGLETDEFLWHNIAGWAFANRDVEMLRRAYEIMLTEPSNLLGQAKWQRVNLMLLLVEGRATRHDVEYAVRHMRVLPQIIEFRLRIWPECVRQGLTDDELERQLGERYEQLRQRPPVPDLEPRTKRILG